MGALTDLNDLTNRATGGGTGTPENIWFHKTDQIGATSIIPVQGRELSLWQFEGAPSAGAKPPGTVAVPDNTTDGGLKQTDPTGGRSKYLTGAGNWWSGCQGMIVIYDRLLHISGLSGIVTTAQAVGGTLTRYATTEAWANQVFVEIYTAIGATGTTISMTYTDQDGNTGNTGGTATIGGTGHSEQGRFIQLPLAAGDTGVRAVADVTLAATTGTAGEFGIVIARPIAVIEVTQLGGGGLQNFLAGIPEIKTDACLAAYFIAHQSLLARLGCWISTVEA